MSKWRQRGFVQDSDEDEEESQIDSQSSYQDGLQRRVERVFELPGARTRNGEEIAEIQKDSDGATSTLTELYGDLEGRGRASLTPRKYTSLRRPSLSPLTPLTRSNLHEERFESPDPLQNSPISKNKCQRLPASPQPQRSTRCQHSSQEEIQLRAHAPPSQILGGIPQAIYDPRRDDEWRAINASTVLGEFGVATLSDHSSDKLNLSQGSDDDSYLSDYPSDLSEAGIQTSATYSTPHRRTAVQIVIPSSTTLQQQLARDEARRRNFRQRKPIQLHPYMLEGEIYRREVQSRGLKPVPRARSPLRRQDHGAAGSQEEEFNPFRNNSSSPADPEIFVSTPVAQRIGHDDQKSISTKRPTQRQRVPHTVQLRVPKLMRKKRPNTTLSQALATPDRTSENSPIPDDIWSIPANSPPSFSSSPTNVQSRKLSLTGNTDSLPTPSNSSSINDGLRSLLDSDSEPVPRSAHRSGGKPRRPIRVILSDQEPSGTDTASSASEQEEGELQKVSKKIRGVLPASWLRIDRQAQERRQKMARLHAQHDVTQAPDSAEPQRGVAQRITKTTGRSAGHTRAQPTLSDVVVISDESDQEPEPLHFRQAADLQRTAEHSSALAALFDDRYADSGDDLITMEHDRLQLPTLGNLGTKRKRQPKITDAFGSAKRAKPSTPMGAPKSNRSLKVGSGFSTRRKQGLTRKARAPLPALSVVDVELPQHIPQFLKLARRAARRDIDQARQSPHRKQIRLQTAQDTDDANATLRQWQQGLLKPHVEYMTSQALRNDAPPADATETRQLPSRPNGYYNISEDSAANESAPAPLRIASGTRRTVDPALALLRRTFTLANRSPQLSKIKKVSKKAQKPAPHTMAPPRAAQLESDERIFGRTHPRIAFQKGLRRVDQQPSDLQGAKQHLLMSRYLADDSALLPPQSAVSDIDEFQRDSLGHVGTTYTIPKRQSRQKPRARRLDADAREYRQPSEPTFESTSVGPGLVATRDSLTEQAEDFLFGLGPPGTRYPISFDVSSLRSDTYFHVETLVGSGELQRALSMGLRDFDEPAGYCVISHGSTTIKCGPWTDETYSQIAEILTTMLPALDVSYDDHSSKASLIDALRSLSTTLRALITYFSEHLSFSDPIDRRSFTIKMHNILRMLFERCSTTLVWPHDLQALLEQTQVAYSVLTYTMVVGAQVYQIAQENHGIEPGVAMLLDTIKAMSRFIVNGITKRTKAMYDFHERNKLHKERENGIRNRDGLIESIVICMHTLESLDVPSLNFWELVSQELSLSVATADQVQTFETLWATIFSLLPIMEFDSSGIPDRERLKTFDNDDWGCICTLLKRLLGLYTSTSRRIGSSINEYIRANIIRCYVLINDWHWKRPDQVLNVIFDFFGKHNLEPLLLETAMNSAGFLHDFAATGSLKLVPNESAFHLALKCLATGLQGMVYAYPEKKLRSFVFRRIPNHGRTYPKDQALKEESLAALRNHHDLLSTLYCAAPASCRPKLDRIRDLVSHETSHREACRISVRAWANLSTFQLSTNESYAALKPFALWYKDIMQQTLKQYRLAKTEADDYLTSGVVDKSTKAVVAMVEQTMQRNQEQVIDTLRDSIAGMKHAIQRAQDQSILTTFLTDSDIVHLLELPHLEDRRLIVVIRETLAALRYYASVQEPQVQERVSQPSDESQDYGDFPDLDDLRDLDDVEPLQARQSATVPQFSPFEFIQGPLWHLISNAFGAGLSPDDTLLLECIDTWVLIAGHTVKSGNKDWSYYINSASWRSWQQLSSTEQTKKFGPYFMAILVARDPAAYREHRQEFLTALLISLADRDSMLRYQHRLLDAIIRVDEDEPLLRNIPFFRTEESGAWDITADSLRSRRLALISSLLANMRDDVHATTVQEPARTPQVKAKYMQILMDFMTTLKNNYLQLQQGARVAGAYVQFVQKIVQFLKQYTSDICPVLPFFTDSVAFPLPTADPAYVVGRLCGYAPKLQDPRTAKELSAFIETITQQSAIDNQQVYLVDQLTRALCTNEAPAADRVALRAMFLQGIFPAYIEVAFDTRIGYLTARPILQCLPAVLDDAIFDLQVSHLESLSATVRNIISIAHAFIRGTEQLKGDTQLLHEPHISSGVEHMFKVAASISRLMDYIVSRTLRIAGHNKLPLITYLDELSIYIAQTLEGTPPINVPSYCGDADVSSLNTQYADILSFCARSLQSTIEINWADDQHSIWFGQGRARREVVYDVDSIESKKERLRYVLEKFHETQSQLRDDRNTGVSVEEVVV